MFVYIFVFLISLSFIYLGEKISNIQVSDGVKIIIGNHVVYLLSIYKLLALCIVYLIAILLPSLLAGFRDYSIGTDVLVYGNTWFHNAVRSTNFRIYVEWAQSSSIGGLYAIFNYVVSRFSSDPHIFYFWYSFVESLLVLFALRRNKIDIFMGMTTYYFLFFNLTLNILRQSMAMVIIIWGFKYISDKKLWKYLLVVWVATGFHNTAIIAVLLYILYWSINGQNAKWLNSSILVLCGLLIIFFEKFISLFLNSGFLGGRYTSYMESTNLRGGFFSHLLLCLPILFLYLISKGNYKSCASNQLYKGFKVFVIFSTLMSIFNLKYVYLGRITQYFDFIFVLSVPYITNHLQLRINDYKGTVATKVITVTWLIIYWIIIYGLMNSGETVPYIFDFN